MQIVLIVITSVFAAVVYGVLHDQITARICVEYFTIGHPRLIDSDSPTVLGLFWGVVATWWVGLPLGIGLALAARVGKRTKLACRQVLRSLVILLCCMFSLAFFAGVIGYLTSRMGVFFLVEPLASRVPAERHVAYLTAGWAHSASYLAGIVGGIILWGVTWRRRGKMQKMLGG